MSVKDIKSYVDLCLEGSSTMEERYVRSAGAVLALPIYNKTTAK